MATLTETAYIARRAIKYGSVGMVGISILWFVAGGLINLWKAANPTPPPPPTVDFGVIAAIKFPESKKKITEFRLQTPTGVLGTFPDRATVFYAPLKQSGFFDPDRAIELARKLNFLFEPTQISETLYSWSKPDPLPMTLEVSIISNWYTLKKQWQADPTLLINKKFVSDKQAILDAQAFLRVLGQGHEDTQGYEKVSYLRVQGDQLVNAISLSEADFVMVNVFRKPFEVLGTKKEVLESYPFHTPDPKKGLISVLVSGSIDPQKKIIDVDYRYTPVEYDVRGEYPLKTVELAFEELKAGKGYVASFDGTGMGVVRRVELGYFDSMGDQKYSMPVYVFTGDQNFVAYVSAVDDAQIEPQR